MKPYSHESGKRRYRLLWKDKYGARYAVKGLHFNEWRNYHRFINEIGGQILDWEWL